MLPFLRPGTKFDHVTNCMNKNQLVYKFDHVVDLTGSSSFRLDISTLAFQLIDHGLIPCGGAHIFTQHYYNTTMMLTGP